MDGVKSIMMDKAFGTAGNRMVIEEFMTGREVSVLSFVDGKTRTQKGKELPKARYCFNNITKIRMSKLNIKQAVNLSWHSASSCW